MASIDPNPLVLNALRGLSDIIAWSRNKGGRDFSGVIPSMSLGSVDMSIAIQGLGAPAPARYGAITLKARSVIDAIVEAPGVLPVVLCSFNFPGIRSGNRTKGPSRPISEAGTQSCYFNQTSVSLTSPIMDMIKTARSGRRRTSSRAAAHGLYIERDGAAEMVGKVVDDLEQDPYSEKKILEKLKKEALARSPEAQQEYLERLGAPEVLGGNLTDADLDALDVASFGTIGATIEERKRFWAAVEASERQPKGDTIVIRAHEHPEWWAKAVDGLDRAPAEIRKQIEKRLASGPGDLMVKVPSATAFKIHRWAVDLDPEVSITIEPGRGGRTQTRIIAELPHELDPRERVEIVRDFTNKLTEKGFPYWAVIHAPDANNDERNFHVHIVYYDRPAAKMKHPATDEEVWDFEILEEKKYASRNKRVIRPYRQEKPRAVSDKRWIPELRAQWEKVSNAALKKAGVAKRYHLGSNASVGIEIDPLKHINSKTFNKERRGELTADGVVLARRQWKVMLDRIMMGHAKRIAKRLDKVGRIETKLAAKARGPRDLASIKAWADRARKRARTFGIYEAYLDITRWCVDRIVSRIKLMLSPDEEAKKGQKPLSNREELKAYVDLIYQRGLLLNQENETGVGLSARRYRQDVEQLAASGDPRKRSGRSVQIEASIFDQDPALKEKKMQRIVETVEAMGKAMLPAIMASIERAEARTSVPQPVGRAAASPQAAPPELAARDGVTSLDARAPGGADASEEPVSHPAPAPAVPSMPSARAIELKPETKPGSQAMPATATPHRSAPQRTLYKSDQQIAAEHADRERAKAQSALGQSAAPRPDVTRPEPGIEAANPRQALAAVMRDASRPASADHPTGGQAASMMPTAPTSAGGPPASRLQTASEPLLAKHERQPPVGNHTVSEQGQEAALPQPAATLPADAERQRPHDETALERRTPSDARKVETPEGYDRNLTAKPQLHAPVEGPETRRPEPPQSPTTMAAAIPMAEHLASDSVSLGRETAKAPVHAKSAPVVAAVPKTGIERVLGKRLGFPGQAKPVDKLKPVPQPYTLTVAPAPIAKKRAKKRDKKRSSDGQGFER